VFEGQQDVGTVLHPGSTDYDPVAKTYTISGAGENMWFATDAFHFVWKRMSGDVTFSADISIVGEGGDPHRKAVLMIRQSLNPDSAYADVAVHGNGLTSLQVRAEKGDATHEIESNVSAPRRVTIIKQGDIFRTLVDGQIAGGSMRAKITGTYYLGIGVCAHDKDAVEKAVFSNVEIGTPGLTEPKLYSTIETINVASTDRCVVYVAPDTATAPEWLTDGKSIEFAGNGSRQRIPVEGGMAFPSAEYIRPEAPGYPVVSPDGKQLAFVSTEGGDVVLRVMSLADNKVRVLAKFPEPRGMITPPAWSPDSSHLVFVSYQYIR
jgi:hypothetical protein